MTRAREVVLAPAKLTWSLHVLGRRDGLHVLDAEMVTLDLCDVLEVAPSSTTTVEVDLEPPASGPPSGEFEDALVRAALAAAGRTARVVLRKRIPLGAGLGGGSADAAAVLRWAGVVDRGVALGLGSDVPFCVEGGHARVRGVGEEVDALAPLNADVTLALLPFGVDTAACYRAFDELPEDRRHHERNDLTAAAESLHPELAAIRGELEARHGRPFVLAGSGSTLFCEGHVLDSAPTASVATVAGPVRLLSARTD